MHTRLQQMWQQNGRGARRSREAAAAVNPEPEQNFDSDGGENEGHEDSEP